MSYLVMECKRAYAIVLDSDGKFLRVANLGYEAGQTVAEVFEEKLKEQTAGKTRRRITHFLAAAACLAVLAFGTDQFLLMPYGTVRIQINPDIMISMNRFHYVVNLEGINSDGGTLIQDYKYWGKKAITVSEELTDLAKEMGYLEKGGEITLTVTGPAEKWKTTTEEKIVTELQHHCSGNAHVKSSSKEESGEDHHTKKGEHNGEKHHQKTHGN